MATMTQLFFVVWLLPMCVECLTPYADHNTVCDETGSFYVNESVWIRLFNHVCQRANRYEIPMIGHDAMIVEARISHRKIVKLDLRRSKFELYFWSIVKWKDETIAWNPKDFEGITSFKIPDDVVWTPDIVFLNQDAGESRSVDASVMAKSDGTLQWTKPVTLVANCKFDIALFPHDIQTCFIELGSWAYSEAELLFSNESQVDIKHMTENMEWRLLNFSIELKMAHIRKKYCQLNVGFTLRRNPSYYQYAIVVPCLMLSALTLVTFWIPSDSGGKVMVGLAVIVSYSAFNKLVAELMPTHSKEIPLLGVYFLWSMVLTTISTVCATFMTFLYHQSTFDRQINPWVKKAAHYVDNHLYGIQKSRNALRSTTIDFESFSDLDLNVTIGDPELNKNVSNKFRIENRRRAILGNVWDDVNHPQSEDYGSDVDMKSSIEEEIKNRKRDNSEDWKVVADVIDRTLFFVYGVGLFTMTVTLLFILPALADARTKETVLPKVRYLKDNL